MKALIPAISLEDNFFNFENINCLRENDIQSLEFFSDFFIDNNLEKVLCNITNFFIYPQWQKSNKKYKFENIEILLKFIETITEVL